MWLVQVSFILSILIEFAAALGPVGIFRKIAASLAILCLSFSSGAVLFDDVSVLTALVVILSFYRSINILRLASSRIEEHYLHRVAWQTTAWLVTSQLLLLSISKAGFLHAGTGAMWAIYPAAVMVFSITILFLTIAHLSATRINWQAKRLTDSELPTVTVAIPARNEDLQLEACLKSVIASDYPKMEVIVLDDCSEDNTSQVIRKFAHDGVRFIHGESPKSHWLAKNQAYEQLFRESNGEILLFCGVDVLLEPQTIRLLISTLKRRKMDMMSIMPVNTQRSKSRQNSFA